MKSLKTLCYLIISALFTTSSIACDSPDVNTKAESSSAIIKDFMEINGKNYIDVDFVTVVEPSDEGVGGISNVNPKIRTYEIDKKEFLNCMQSETVSLDEIWTHWEAVKTDEPLYWIEAKNGKVRKLYLECAG